VVLAERERGVEDETLASGRSDAQIPLVRSLSSLLSIKTGSGGGWIWAR